MEPRRPSRHGLTRRLGPLQREFLLNPVTALALYTSAADGRDYLLAGEDNHVRIYDVETAGPPRGDIAVFPAQSVHGIAVGGDSASNSNNNSGSSSARDDDISAGTGPWRRRILVWGGFSVAVLTAEAIEACIASGGSQGGAPPSPPLAIVTARAPDWILEGVLSPHGTGDELALLTAHNELIEGRFREDAGALELGVVSSPSRPILYSGNLSWEAPDCILVAAGTVFGEIVVWKYRAGSVSSSSEGEQDESSQRCEVLYVFSGHEGSIFGVHISHVLETATGERLRLLASCSDDRTVRVWDITDSRDLSRMTHDEYQKKILAARETGFGDSIESTWQEETSARCLAVAMGHISRIWQVRFPRRQSLDGIPLKIELWSFGEDTTAQKWSLSLGASGAEAEGLDKTPIADLPSRTRAQLKNEAIYANHSGKNLWSHAMNYDKTGQLQVVTGGSDGNISLIGNSERVVIQRVLDAVPQPPMTTPSETDSAAVDTKGADPERNHGTPGEVPEEKEATPIAEEENPENSKPKTKKKKPKVKKVKDDYFNRYAFTADGNLLGVTKAGRFFVGGSESDDSWKELFLPDEFSDTSSYAVIKGSTRDEVVFVGTAGGDVFIYRGSGFSSLSHLTKVHGKVADIFVLSSSKSSPRPQDSTEKSYNTPLYLLVTILGSESAALIKIDASGERLETTQTSIPVDKSFIVTSAALHDDLLVLGSRNGLISVFKSTPDGSYEPQVSVEAKIDDCVTSITMLPSSGDTSSTCFLVTCRDGKYRIYDLAREHESVSVTPLHETSPPFGPMIEGALFSSRQAGDGVDLILYGFRSTKFVVWNETQRRELAAIDCGGGHRTYAFDPLPGRPEGFRLAWTQVSRLCYFSQTHAAHRTLKPGGHGREIKAVSAAGDLVATAAEDTAIRLWGYGDNGGTGRRALRCLAVMENHTAGIQSMKWHGQSHLFSSAGNKEFFVWRVSRKLLDGSAHHRGLAVRCEAAYPDRDEDVDLRIMDFDVHRLAAGAAGDDNDEDSDQPGKKTFLISMALSNSTLLTYLYSEAAGFRLVAKGAYTGACMTQLRHLDVEEDGGDPAAPTTPPPLQLRLRTLTAATDGHMTVWEAQIRAPTPPRTAGPADLAGDAPAPVVLSEHRTVQVARLHQSTIKSLDLRRLAPAPAASASVPFVIVTGGDDNALGVMHVLLHRGDSSSPSATVTVLSKSIVRSAHGAAVTGLAILSSTDAAGSGEDCVGEVTLAVGTCSNDQRVRRWAVTVAPSDGGGPVRPVRVVLTDDRYSAIADSGDLEVLGGDHADGSGQERFIVGGVGVEVWGCDSE